MLTGGDGSNHENELCDHGRRKGHQEDLHDSLEDQCQNGEFA